MYNYTAYSLEIQSELMLRPLVINPIVAAADVSIRFGQLPAEGLSDAVITGLYYQVKPGAFLLHVPHVSKFLVTDGKEIIVEPAPNMDEHSLAAFLLGPCIAALLMQRDLFVLQGTVLKAEDKQGIAIIGRSGTGKSTLAAAFLRKGYFLLSEDICAINTQMEVMPGFPQLSLWFHSVWSRCKKAPWFKRIRPGIEKYAIPLTHKFYANPLPLKTMFIINPSKQHHKIQATHLLGGNKIKYLQKHVYNESYVSGFKKEALYFNYCANLASQVDVILIDRPVEGCPVKDVVRFIETMRGLAHVV